MATREEKIAFLQNKMAGAQSEPKASGPTREEKIAFLQNKMSERPKDSPSKIESALRGAAQGASLGFADEIVGGVKAFGKDMVDAVTGKGSADGDYKQFRDEYRQADKSAKDENPASYTSGEIGGGLATVFIPGMGVVKGAKILNLAKQGAAIGGVAGAGYSESGDLSGIAKDAAVGAAIGAAAPYALKGAGKVIKGAGRGAKNSAERFAARAVGAERGTIKKYGADKVQQAGRYALDNKIITPINSTDDLISRNNATKSAAMNTRKAAYEQIDDAGRSTFTPLEVAEQVESKVIGELNRKHNDTQTLIKKLEPELENILSRGNEPIPMVEAQVLVERLGKKAKFDTSRSNEANELAKDIYHTVRRAINDAAEKGSESINLGDVVKKANKDFSSAKVVEALLENKHAREQGNKLFSLTDNIILGGGAGGAVVSGGASIPATAGLIGLKKGLERFGSQNSALLLDKIGNVLSKAPSAAKAAQRAPLASQNVIAKPFRSSTRELAHVAKNENPKKGPKKWANDGFEKVKKQLKDESKIKEFEKSKSSMLQNKKLKNLFISASSLKPGSKAMNKIIAEIENGDY